VRIVSLLERNVDINQRVEHYWDHVNENRGSVSMKKNKTKRVGHEWIFNPIVFFFFFQTFKTCCAPPFRRCGIIELGKRKKKEVTFERKCGAIEMEEGGVNSL
jgi:hypothetical protein